MKRQIIEFHDYKNRPTKVPISKNNSWFNDSRGSYHCTVQCRNFADVVYITDYGFGNYAYCQSDAETRIMHIMITGELSRGIWCVPDNGKLKPHWYYKYYMDDFEKSHPKQAKKLKQKLKDLKLTLSQKENQA